MAGRIPDSFLQDLLARSDIVEVIGSRLELKRAGREYKARSPFTNEKSPSFFVNPLKQMFFDFSSGKNGTVITFLMEYDRLSFVEAVEELAQRAGVEIPREGGPAAVVMEGPLDALAAAQRFFRDQLKLAPQAIEYLKKRGVNGETAKLYGIGFAPESWNALADFLKDPQHALDAGLVKKSEKNESRVYDVFRNRIMFPIRDTRGRVIAFGGRTMANDPAKYLNSPETALFHKGRNLYGLYEARQSSKTALPYLIVVEGYMDVVMLAQYGVHEVVGTLGTATTPEHLKLLFKATQKVVFCFDGDRAGRSAASRALENVLPEIYDQREAVFMFIPEGHDPDTWVQEIGTEAFRAKVSQAMPLSEFLLTELQKEVNLGSLEGRAKLAGLARAPLAKLREGPLHTLLLDELARLTRMSRVEFERHMERPAAVPVKPAPTPSESEDAPASLDRGLVRRALELLLDQPALAEDIPNHELLAQSDAPGIGLLLDAVDFFQSHAPASAGQLLEHWREHPKKVAAMQRLLRAEVPSEPAACAAEFMDALRGLVEQARKTRMQTLLSLAGERSLTAAETREMRELAERKKHPNH